MELFKDWKRALWRAPLHLAASVPVAAASLIIPPLGKAYIAWRMDAESEDQRAGRDTPEKAEIDLYTQTVLVSAILRIWGNVI